MVQGKERQSMERLPENNDGQNHRPDERSVRPRIPVPGNLQCVSGHNGYLQIAAIGLGWLMRAASASPLSEHGSNVLKCCDAYRPFSTVYLIASPSKVA